MQTARPDTNLPVGTVVIVKNQKGYVTKCERVPATPCGMINVHTIRFTDRKVILSGLRSMWKKLDQQKEERVNYSFIRY